MAKAKVTVNRTTELEIEISDEFLTTEALAEFSKHVCQAKTSEDIFNYVGKEVARNMIFESFFVYGIGKASKKPWHGNRKPEEVKIEFNEIFDDITTEVELDSEGGQL